MFFVYALNDNPATSGPDISDPASLAVTTAAVSFVCVRSVHVSKCVFVPVDDPPGAPTSLAIVAYYDVFTTISWLPPSLLGGGSGVISSYVLTQTAISNAGETASNCATTLSFVLYQNSVSIVTVPGKQYSYTVLAQILTSSGSIVSGPFSSSVTQRVNPIVR